MRSCSTLSSISDAARAGATTTQQARPALTVLGKGLGAEASAAELLRRYQLGEELGRGEFGVTRRCTDTSTGETLACKSISKRKLRSSVDIEDVRREVAIMRSLPDHANVVRLREAFEDGDTVHLVMEVCEGGELFDRIVSRGHYTERAAAGVMRTIMEVVLVRASVLPSLLNCMSACARILRFKKVQSKCMLPCIFPIKSATKTNFCMASFQITNETCLNICSIATNMA